MNLQQAERIARHLMSEYNLNDWNFSFNNRFTSCLGRCSYRRKLIELGTKYVELNSEDQVVNTILHEICHALLPNAGHNKYWKELFIKMGGSGQTMTPRSEIVAPEKRRTNKRKPRTEYINVKGVFVEKGKELTLINDQKCTFEEYEPNNRKYKFLVNVGGMIYKVSEDQIKFS
jgi:predicted SprT family Zn-dependent metalloprotease